MCAYCGKAIHPIRDFQVDHVIPFAHGGSDEIQNLVASCRRCNVIKGKASIEEFRTNQKTRHNCPRPAMPVAVVASSADTFTISQAAARLGVHATTLRTWAEKGMVKMIKLPSGYRRFEPAEIERVRKEMGLTTEGDDKTT
jgi:excisionase family DNA binding protein